MIPRLTLLSLLLLSSFSVHAQEVAKERWMEAMTTALPMAFCNSAQYFRQCFEVTAPECEETAISATRVCLLKYQQDIPPTLMQPRDGTHWGQILGKCAGEAYETSLINKRISSDKCNNPGNWM